MWRLDCLANELCLKRPREDEQVAMIASSWRCLPFNPSSYLHRALWFTPDTLPVVGLDVVEVQDDLYALRALESESRNQGIADAWLRAVQYAQFAHDRLLHDLHDVDRNLSFWQQQMAAGGRWSHIAFMLLGRGPFSFAEEILLSVQRFHQLVVQQKAILRNAALIDRHPAAKSNVGSPPQQLTLGQQEQQPHANEAPAGQSSGQGEAPSATDMMQDRVLLLRGWRQGLAAALAQLTEAAAYLRLDDALAATSMEKMPYVYPGTALGAMAMVGAAAGQSPRQLAQQRLQSVEAAVHRAVRGMRSAMETALSSLHTLGPHSSSSQGPTSPSGTSAPSGPAPPYTAAQHAPTGSGSSDPGPAPSGSLASELFRLQAALQVGAGHMAGAVLQLPTEPPQGSSQPAGLQQSVTGVMEATWGGGDTAVPGGVAVASKGEEESGGKEAAAALARESDGICPTAAAAASSAADGGGGGGGGYLTVSEVLRRVRSYSIAAAMVLLPSLANSSAVAQGPSGLPYSSTALSAPAQRAVDSGGPRSARTALDTARRAAALAGPLVPLPSGARIPSRLQRHWLRYTAAAGLALYGSVFLVRHSRLAGSDDLERWLEAAATATSSAFRTHVAEPLAAVRDELFRTFRDRPSIVSSDDFALSRESLLRMLTDFAADHKNIAPATLPSSTTTSTNASHTGRTASVGIIAATAAAPSLPAPSPISEAPTPITSGATSGGSGGNGGTGGGLDGDAAVAAGMTVLMAAYEAELRRPLRNLLLGDLARALLIQVQHVKVDGEAAMLRLDQILRANELSLSLMAALPALGAAALAAAGLARLLAPRAPDPRTEAVPARLAMAALEVALEELVRQTTDSATSLPEAEAAKEGAPGQGQSSLECTSIGEGDGGGGGAVVELRGLVVYRLHRAYAEIAALYARADRTSRASEWRQLHADLLRLATPRAPGRALSIHRRMMRTYSVLWR